MAENTTKDIWNDEDGEREEGKKRGHLLRNFLIFLLMLIAVLGLVLVAAWRDGTGFDALRRYFAYGTEAVGGEKIVYRYDADNTNRFARVGTGSLVILSDTSLRLLGPDGGEVWSANVKMHAPALGQGGGLAVAYDIGGTALYVLDETGPRLELTSDGAELIARLDGGDEGVKSQLIERNLRLVVYIARRFENTGVGIEDLISIGTIGLIKAINTFNPEKKIKLATYASRCIENEILMYLRRNNKTRMEVSIDEPLNVDWDGNELLLSDILGTEEDVIYQGLEQEAEHRVLGSAVSKLSEREQVIVKLRFGINMPEGREKTQKEVADLLGISQSYISRLEKRIMKRLRKEIARYE